MIRNSVPYLVFAWQVGGDSPGSLLSNRMHQQVSPCITASFHQ